MIEYIIGVVFAINILCNFGLIFSWIALYDLYKNKIYIRKPYKVVFIISLLGVIFIPSRETLEILLK